MSDVLAAIHEMRGIAPRPRAGVDDTPVVVAQLLAAPDADGIAVVMVAGSDPLRVPAAPSTYTGVVAAYTLMRDGRPVMVTGPIPAPPAPPPTEPPAPTLPPPTPAPATTQAVSDIVVTPTSSGTWRATRSAWDRWNDSTDVYQAGSGSSGALSGIACYGSRITALGLTSIASATLTLVSNGHGLSSSWSAAIMGSAHDSLPGAAPSLAATSSSVTVPGYGRDGESVSVALDATTRENLRTGTWRSLGLGTAGTYGGTRGVRDSRGWVLTIAGTVTR